MSEHAMNAEYAILIQHPRPVLRDAQSIRDQLAQSQEAAPLEPSDMRLMVEDHLVPSWNSEEMIPIRIYRGRDSRDDSPVLLYLHGGGFFCGDLRSDEWQCAQYAQHARCAVVCVQYRLAPEDPYPAALHDCYGALEYLWDHAEDLNFDRQFFAIGGSSAGANLAAAVALMARDIAGPRLCFQMLMVPALDDRLETDSSLEFVDVPDFGRAEAETMWRWYLGDRRGDVPPYAAPARSTNLDALPDTFILCAGLDPLRDEGLDYARRLTKAGVAVELHLIPSIPHGFASVRSATLSEYLLTEQIHVLRRVFWAKYRMSSSAHL